MRAPNPQLAAGWRLAIQAHGPLVTLSEAGRMLGVPRQTIHYWTTSSQAMRLTPVQVAGDQTGNMYVPLNQVLRLSDETQAAAQLAKSA